MRRATVCCKRAQLTTGALCDRWLQLVAPSVATLNPQSDCERDSQALRRTPHSLCRSRPRLLQRAICNAASTRTQHTTLERAQRVQKCATHALDATPVVVYGSPVDCLESVDMPLTLSAVLAGAGRIGRRAAAYSAYYTSARLRWRHSVRKYSHMLCATCLGYSCQLISPLRTSVAKLRPLD